MKTFIYVGLVMSAISCIPVANYAQVDSGNTKKFSSFRIGVMYNSHLNYYGRTDSLRSSAVIPTAEYWISKKFYLSATPVFVNNKFMKLAYSGTVITAGYQFSDTNKYAAHFYLVKPLYKKSSDLIQSALKAQAAANFTRLNKYINITVGADIKFSDKPDLGLTAGIDHLLHIPVRKSRLFFDPSVYLFAGTQRFTETYLSKKDGFLLFPGGQEMITKQTEHFNIIAYEFSMPVILSVNNTVQTSVTPAYVIPRNDASAQQSLVYVTIGMKLLL